MSLLFVFFKQQTAYELRMRDWISDVCSSDLIASLETAAALSGVTFNADKTQSPGNRVRSFNITFGSGTMEVVEDRIAECEIAIRGGSDQMIAGIVGYVDGINADQGNRLMEACENAPAGE